MQIDLQQGSQSWHAFRATHFGASEAAAMLGLSTTTTRTELLRLKKLGIGKEFDDWTQKNVLDKGHEVEALARPIIEARIGQDLYATTHADGRISASVDGLTLNETIAWECKLRNAANFATVQTGQVPPQHMPQCQQVLMVTGAKKLIFTVSDGTREGTISTDVLPDEDWFERIRAGWRQFARDLQNWQPPPEAAPIVGRAPESLPALRIEVTGQVTASNLADFKTHALAVFDSIKTHLQTDEDFADADKTTKWCKAVEDKLIAAKDAALSQTASIDELFRTIDDLCDAARQKRLLLEKLVKQRKDSIRMEKVQAAREAFTAHRATLERDLGGISLTVGMPDFGGAIKGLKTLASIDDKIDAHLVNAKIALGEEAADIRAKLAWVDANAAGHRALLADLQTLIAKPMDDFQRAITVRIEAHNAAQQARLDKERERIRAEEQAAAQAALVARPSATTALVAHSGAVDERQTRVENGAGNVPPVAPTQPALASSPAPTAAGTAAAGIAAGAATGAAPRSPEPSGPPTLRLGEINKRIAPLSITADGLSQLGIANAATDRSARLYHQADYPRICAAIIAHIQQAVVEMGARS